MIDEQLDALEDAAKAANAAVLELIAALRQARAERDWLAVNLANGLVDPGCIEHLAELGGISPPDPATLIEAAEEAVCPK